MGTGRLLTLLAVLVALAGGAWLIADRETATQDTTTWAGYNGSYSGQRHVDLREISASNVDQLNEQCRVQVGDFGVFHAGPVLVDGRMFVTTIHVTTALDPTDCSVLWQATYVPDEEEAWNTNRGVAVSDGRVFRGTGDGRLVAYDAETGAELWRTALGDPTAGAWIAAAPLAWDGIVYTSLAGSEWGVQGRMFAVDAETGDLLWTFNLVPQEGEPGVETWSGTSYETGGGGSWTSYALDPETEEIFIPVANPAPDFDRDYRRGDNLYTDSLVVLDARTGEYRWHFQSFPNEAYDYGITTPPMLFAGSEGRRLVALGSKDGHLYVVDRATRELVFSQAVTTIRNRGALLSSEPVEICPGALGGIEWNGPSLDPSLNLLVVGAVDYCSRLSVVPEPYRRGELFLRGIIEFVGTPVGHITAVDAADGSIRWQLDTAAPVVSGITTTASGLTFVGDLAGTFYILETASGEILRTFDTGGAMAGGIITYSANGRQYVAVTSGNVSRSSLGNTGRPTVIIYALGDAPAAAQPAAAPASQQTTEALFAQSCAQCHGRAGEGGTGPSLRNIGARKTREQIAEAVRQPPGGMPRLYPDVLTAAEVERLAAYVHVLN